MAVLGKWQRKQRSHQLTQAITQKKFSVTVTHDLATWMGIFLRFH